MAARRLNFRRAEAKGRAGAAKGPKEPLPKIDFTGKEPLGKCPKCGGKVFDTEAGYLCEKSQADAKPCKFKINREILQQPIEPAQAQKFWPRTRPICSTSSSPRPGNHFRRIS